MKVKLHKKITNLDETFQHVFPPCVHAFLSSQTRQHNFVQIALFWCWYIERHGPLVGGLPGFRFVK